MLLQCSRHVHHKDWRCHIVAAVVVVVAVGSSSTMLRRRPRKATEDNHLRMPLSHWCNGEDKAAQRT